MNGYLDASIYVILSSVAFVFLDKMCNNIDPITALFAMSGIALICFNLLCIKELKKTYMACLQNSLIFFLMSFALGLDWLCLTYGTHLSDPFITMASLFVALAFFGFAKLYINNRAISHLISMLLLLVSMLVLYFTYQINESRQIIFGFMLGTLAGIAFFIYIIFSDILTRKGELSSMQILATRFWILFVGSFLFLPTSNTREIIQANALPLILISLCSLIIPIYFNQQAIKKLGPATASVLISFVPPVTYSFDAWYNKNLNLSNSVVCILIALSLILPKLFLLRQNAKDTTNEI